MISPEKRAVMRGNARYIPAFLLLFALVWGVGTAIGNQIRHSYRIGVDLQEVRCMPWRLYLISMGQKPTYSLGEYVAFRDLDGQMGPKWQGRTIGKQIAGLPGDVLVVRNDFAWINGRAIGPLATEKLGVPHGSFDRVAVVPAGKVLVLGTEDASFDGRYWGFLEQRNIVGLVRPLI